MAMTLGELAERIGARLRGDASLSVTGVATLASAGEGQVSFLANAKYHEALKSTGASAVILSEADAAAWEGNALVSANPYLAFAKASACFLRDGGWEAGVHASAVVHETATVDRSASVGAGCVIGENAVVGANVRIGPNCTVERDVSIGPDTRIHGNVVLCHEVVIGARCILHPGVVIGADGFGQARDGEGWFKVPQLGSVRIGDDVEIGANTTVDRGALDDTVIENGVKLDNQIQVAHNVRIGAHTAIAGCTAIAGSAKIGRRCMIGGAVGIVGHLEIADDVTVLAMTLVSHSIHKAGIYSGSHPIEEVGQWRRNSARLRQLDELARKVRRLEQRLRAIEGDKDND